MRASSDDRLIQFLRDELAVPTAAIAFAMKQCEENVSLLPITLWQYGLVKLEELDRIFDWLATVQTLN